MAILIALVVLTAIIVPLIFQMLWNSTIPEIFGLKSLRYWQAFRLLLIAFLLFSAGGLVHFNIQ